MKHSHSFLIYYFNNYLSQNGDIINGSLILPHGNVIISNYFGMLVIHYDGLFARIFHPCHLFFAKR